MRKLITSPLKLFAAFIAEQGITKVLIAAGGAGFRFGHLFDLGAAPGTKFSIGSQIFAAFGTLVKDELLMTTLGAEFGVNRYGMLAIRTVNTRLFLFLLGLR